MGAAVWVVAVSRDAEHRFSKQTRPEITLLAGLGVDGDAHAGATVRHRSRYRGTTVRPNLRQVHLLHSELLDELATQGHVVRPGEMGENVTTRGVDLLGLPTGTRLTLGAEAVVEVTGLRNPCWQIDRFQHGVLKAVLDRDEDGRVIRKAGVMAVVVYGGVARADDPIGVHLPAGPARRLAPV